MFSLTDKAVCPEDSKQFMVLPQLGKLSHHEVCRDLFHALKGHEWLQQVNQITCPVCKRNANGHPKIHEEHRKLSQRGADVLVVAWHTPRVAEALRSRKEDPSKVLMGGKG